MLALRKALGGVVAAEANAAGHKAVTVVVDPVKGSRLSPGQIAAHIALGARLRNYRFDKYKTKDKPEQKLSLEQLTDRGRRPGRGAQGLCRSSSRRSTPCSSPATW